MALQSVAEQFRIAQQGTLEQTRALIVRVAKTENARVMGEDPKPGSFKRFVDGQQGAAEETVKANGIIVYQYNRLDVVVRFALAALFEKSPVLSGEYRHSHTIFLNGSAVQNLQSYKPGDQIAISNLKKYSRKIEIGKMTMRVPGTDHVYMQAEQLTRKEHGRIARIEFTYRGFVGSGVVGGRAGNESKLRYPTLIISER